MLWLEVSHDEEHGGEGWEFSKCLWSPARKKGGARWPYWETLLQVEAGDDVIHVQGEGKKAVFVGTSVAASDGYETDARPPKPGQWDHRGAFYRVDLRGFRPLPEPFPLPEFFSKYGGQLRDIFEENKTSDHKIPMFFVIQGGRVQCQNGGYLTPVTAEIASYIFRDRFTQLAVEPSPIAEVTTDERLRGVMARVGQSKFSKEVLADFGHVCCFPECTVNERNFLIGAHIDRWADDVERRGSISNGICLCLMHDKAFEIGYFTIDCNHRASINLEKTRESSWATKSLSPHHGKELKPSKVSLNVDALARHWARIGYAPEK